jgi:hypothetical protein
VPLCSHPQAPNLYVVFFLGSLNCFIAYFRYFRPLLHLYTHLHCLGFLCGFVSVVSYIACTQVAVNSEPSIQNSSFSVTLCVASAHNHFFPMMHLYSPRIGGVSFAEVTNRWVFACGSNQASGWTR